MNKPKSFGTALYDLREAGINLRKAQAELERVQGLRLHNRATPEELSDAVAKFEAATKAYMDVEI